MTGGPPPGGAGARARAIALVRALRPAQWLKSVPVGAALVFGHRLGDPAARGRVALAAAAFCALASAGYLVNDVHDREADRAHPLRRARPVASGTLSPAEAILAAAGLGAAGLGIAAALPAAAAWALAGYAALTLAYTFVLRRVPGAGPAAVAAGFLLRVEAGAGAAGVEASAWLLGLTGVLALALALAKREAEARRVAGAAPATLVRLVDGLLLAAAAGYALYTQAPDTVALHGTRWLGATAVPVAGAIQRFRWLLRRDRTGRGPAEVAASDPVLLVLGGGWLVLCALVLRGR